MGAVVAVIGAVIGAGSAVVQGQDAKKQADFQANVARQQAASERQAAQDQERDYRRSQSLRLSQIRADMGASGTDINTGTSLLAITDFERETELNALRIRSGGDISASRLSQLSGFYRSSAGNAQTAGWGRAGSALLTGASDYYKAGGTFGPGK